MLADSPQFLIVGDASTGTQALHLVERHVPDVLVLDLALERVGALEVLDRLATSKSPRG